MAEDEERTLAAVSAGEMDPLKAAEAAFDRGELELAEACLEVGLGGSAAEPRLLRFAARFYSADGRLERATALLEQLELSDPLSAAELALIGAQRLARGDNRGAEDRLGAAVALSPEDAGYRHLWVTALARLGRFRDVIWCLLGRVRRGIASEVECEECTTAALRAGRSRLGRLICAAGVRCYPDASRLNSLLARIYIDLGQYDAAIKVLVREPHCRVDSPDIAYLASVAYAMLRRYEEALSAIDGALSAEPEQLEYLRHKIAVLGCLERHQEAARLYDRLFSNGAEDEATWRAAFATYSEAGRYEQAVAVGAKLLQAKPQDLSFASVYQTVLGKHLYTNLLASGATAPPRRTRSAPLFRRRRERRLGMAGRTVQALILREMKTRFGRSRWGYLWVLFEPLAHVGVMISVISFLNRTGKPPIGPSFALFYFTGIISFHMCTHTASHMQSAVAENRPLLQIPRVHLLDVFAARALLEGLTELLVGLILVTLFLSLGMDAMPIDVAGVLGVMGLLWLVGMGVGMINAVISTFFAGWERVWGAMTSVLYFSSGTFFIPRMMPVAARDILKWNPVLQGIELVRVHYFHEPPPHWAMPGYLIGWALVTPAVGLGLERLFRRRMLDLE